MFLLLLKMIKSLITLSIATTVLIYLILICTNNIYYEKSTDWNLMFSTVYSYYKAILVDHTLGDTRFNISVFETVQTYFTRSLNIIIPSYLISNILGVVIGVISFLSRKKRLHKLFKFQEMLLGTIPDFIIFIIIQICLVYLFNLGMPKIDLYGYENWYSFLLPTIVISVVPTFYISTITYQSLINEKDLDYVRTAYSKGINTITVILRHVLWNSWSTILNYTQTVMLLILTSLPLIEKLAGYKGAGVQLLVAINEKNTNLIIGYILVFLFLVLISLWVTDFVKFFLVPTMIDNELAKNTLSKANRFRTLKVLYDHLKHFPYKEVSSKILSFLKTYPALSIGGIIISTLIFFAITAPVLPFVETQYDDYVAIWDKNNKLIPPPVPPGELFLFGSDRLGRDLFSIILLGAKETLSELLVIALIRFFISIPLGYFASINKGANFLLGIVNNLFSFLPSIILIILIAKMPYFEASTQRHALLITIIALLDVGRIAEILRLEFTKINNTEYMKSAIVAGNKWLGIIKRYYIPNIYQRLIYILVNDMARIMVLLGGLAIVEVYLSQEIIIDEETGKIHIMNLSFSWPSLLAKSISDLKTAPWLPFFPSIFIAITIIGLNLLGSGLKDYLDHKKAKINK